MNRLMSESELSKYHEGVNQLKSKLIEEYYLGGSILDVGCGNGLYSLEYANMGIEVQQIDIADRRNKLAKSIPFIAANIESYDLRDGDTNNIIAFDIIEHLDNDDGFVKKVYTWLSDGGRMFVSVPNEDNSLLEKLNLAHIHFTDKTHQREYSRKSLQALFEVNGFKVITLKPYVNKMVSHVPILLARESLFSRVCAKIITWQIRVLEKVGLLKNTVVSDWFIVLEKR